MTSRITFTWHHQFIIEHTGLLQGTREFYGIPKNFTKSMDCRCYLRLTLSTLSRWTTGRLTQRCPLPQRLERFMFRRSTTEIKMP